MGILYTGRSEEWSEDLNKRRCPNGRYLIITADDFGLCNSMNEAIMELWDTGAITSAMIMMPGPWAKQAADYTVHNREANIGVHLTLTSSFPQYKWGPVTRDGSVQSLITAHGYFWEKSAEVERYAAEEAVRTEVRNQLEAAIRMGIDPTHLDSHEGSLLGLAGGRDFLELTFDLCEEYGLPFKLPRNIVNQPFLTPQMRELFQKRIDSADRRGITLIDDLIILPYEYEDGEEYPDVKCKVFKAVQGMKAGITELVIHPSRDTAEMRTLTPSSAKREMEYNLCMDGEFRQLLENEEIRLISWKDVRDEMRLVR
ncbi:polysaccharide deacetylase family protein [Paenibacillus borealis]|uniref:polysaccharide deacetylase family protein n=1 Tax=Paenibacillus borealis TaxID=160799 RepID=UPI0005AB4E3B|nr:polysaccharide deacetylase family protein [Paenibacillus borealis]